MAAETRIALERCRVLQRGTELSYPTGSKPCSARNRSFDTVHCVHASSPDGRASRPAIRAASTLASGELEENLECEGEGTAAVDEVARLAEIGL